MQSDTTQGAALPRLEYRILIGIALLKLLIHLYTNLFAGYGIFRDELYYLACSNHPDAGYVDQPPLSILILIAGRLLFGNSLFALRLLPALAGAANVFLTGMLARELGGRRYAQALAALASLVSIINLGFDAIYSMNAFDLLFWTVAALLLARLLRTRNPILWIPLGVVLGLGLLNKISMLWLGAGIGAALLFTNQRLWLKTRWPWLAAVIAVLLFSPFVLWNLSHDLAHLEFVRNASAGKYSGLSAWSFIVGQFIINNPVTVPLWLAGFVYLLFSKGAREFRPLGIIFLSACLILIINGHSKSEYLAAAFSIVFAAGGVAVESLSSAKRLKMVQPALVVLLVLGLLLAPTALPILPVRTYIAYAEALGIEPSTAEQQELAELPQFYADMFGWENMARTVASVYAALSPEERRDCIVFGNNYGEAGAMDYFRGKYDLPPAIGRHNSYWLWGWGQNPRPSVIILIGGEPERYRERCGDVVEAAVVRSDYAMPYENNLPIYVCRDLKVTLEEIWPQVKVFH